MHFRPQADICGATRNSRVRYHSPGVDAMGRTMSARQLWSVMCYSRWLLWLVFLGYALEFYIHRRQHMYLGQFLPTTEAWMFGLGLAAVAVGIIELKTRDKAGIKKEPENKIGFDR